jgi:hypothetical protein
MCPYSIIVFLPPTDVSFFDQRCEVAVMAVVAGVCAANQHWRGSAGASPGLGHGHTHPHKLHQQERTQLDQHIFVSQILKEPKARIFVQDL